MKRIALVLVLTAGCSSTATENRMPEGPSCVKNEAGTACLRLAPKEQRVDLTVPAFSDPTKITNPLHPSSAVAQTLYGGRSEGEPFRSEVTLLPEIKTLTWQGRQIKALTQQYTAFVDDRIAEVALDWFAQADDGSVWYLGEDVFNYEDGVVKDTDGTWQVGHDNAPPAMIMPARPETGAVYRPENLPGVVFEEVKVKATGQTVQGPTGPVTGAMTVTETHMDGATEDKVFAPGYGEFSTGDPQGDLEAAVLAVPTDARPGPTPAALLKASAAADAVFNGKDAMADLRRALEEARMEPKALHDRAMNALRALEKAKGAEIREAAPLVTWAVLDLRLRYEPREDIDRARFVMWSRRLVADAEARDKKAIAGDLAAMSWTYDRFKDPHLASLLTRLKQTQDPDALAELAATVKA